MNVANKGFAQINTQTQYVFQLEADTFSPTKSGTGGNKKLNVKIIIYWIIFKETKKNIKAV